MVKAADGLGCRKSMASRLRDFHLPLYPVLAKSHLEHWVQF